MKTIQLSLTAILLAVTIATTAIERPRVNMIPLNSEKAIVAVTNEKAARFEVGIYTSGGEMVYYRQTRDQVKDYRKLYDFKNLAEGKYVLSLKVNDTQVTNDFEVSDDGIKVGQKKVSYDPYFSFKNNELKLSYLNFGQNDLKLLIYGPQGLVYEKSIGSEFNVTKGLDLSKLVQGAYDVVLNMPGKEYSYRIVK